MLVDVFGIAVKRTNVYWDSASQLLRPRAPDRRDRALGRAPNDSSRPFIWRAEADPRSSTNTRRGRGNLTHTPVRVVGKGERFAEHRVLDRPSALPCLIDRSPAFLGSSGCLTIYGKVVDSTMTPECSRSCFRRILRAIRPCGLHCDRANFVPQPIGAARAYTVIAVVLAAEGDDRERRDVMTPCSEGAARPPGRLHLVGGIPFCKPGASLGKGAGQERARRRLANPTSNSKPGKRGALLRVLRVQQASTRRARHPREARSLRSAATNASARGVPVRRAGQVQAHSHNRRESQQQLRQVLRDDLGVGQLTS